MAAYTFQARGKTHCVLGKGNRWYVRAWPLVVDALPISGPHSTRRVAIETTQRG